METAVVLFGFAAAALTLLAALLKGTTWLFRLALKVNRWLDAVNGEPPRDGSPARPSLMSRVQSIEHGQATHLVRDHGAGSAPAPALPLAPAPPPRANGAGPSGR